MSPVKIELAPARKQSACVDSLMLSRPAERRTMDIGMQIREAFKAGRDPGPIGSIAKPIVYLAALEQGTYTPATFVLDEPVELKLLNGQMWKPENFTKTTRHGELGRGNDGARRIARGNANECAGRRLRTSSIRA